jgi:DUF4097 and DUF4098 domain-containing protein YvlB
MNTRQKLAVTGEHCIVSVEAVVDDVEVRGWDRAEVGVDAAEDHVVLSADGESIKVRARAKSMSVFAVCVPRSCTVRVNSVSGDVALQDVSGDVTIQSMSGDVAASNVRGKLWARAVSGDVSVRDSCLHDASLETVSGDMHLETPLNQEGRYLAHSTSGNLHLCVPQNQGLTVAFRTLSGDLSTSLPHSASRPHENLLHGWATREFLVNGGGVVFDVTTSCGDVHVDVAAEAPEEPFEAESDPWAQPARPADGRVSAARTTSLLTETPGDEPFRVETEPPEASRSRAEQRMAILRQIESGELSVDEGLAKLREI